jgi:hypothetical protein
MRNLKLTQLAVGALTTVACLTALATPPRSNNDGGGMIDRPPPARPSCPSVDLESAKQYPRALKAELAKLKPGTLPGKGDVGGPLVVDHPLVPGGVVQVTPLSASQQRVCVQPFVVNGGASASPATAKLYLTTSPAKANLHTPERDQPLVVSPQSNVLIEATLPSVAAGTTHVLNQAWCTNVAAGASAPVLSLFLNVPEQKLGRALAAQSLAEQTQPASGANSTQRRVPDFGALAVKPAHELTTVMAYTTLCKVDQLDAGTSAQPQPRLLDTNGSFKPGSSINQAVACALGVFCPNVLPKQPPPAWAFFCE